VPRDPGATDGPARLEALSGRRVANVLTMSWLDGFLQRRSARAIQQLPPVVATAAHDMSALDPCSLAGSGSSPDRQQEVATLGAGCFWCLDAIARRTPGILSSVVGYGGGPPPAPTYYDLHRADSPHVETVQLTFDPKAIDFRAVLDLFFRSHDPTTENRDGANRGPSYHSTIFCHSVEQRQVAEAAVCHYEALLGRPVVTSLRPFTTFFPAEPEHQDFFNANPTHPYCTFVVIPKLKKVLGES
jgi:peptide-methionine (S)-S-oxide reductase